MTDVLGGPEIPWSQASAWAASRGAPAWWCELAELCWAIRGWPRPEVQWAQACKETGFGRFGGAVSRDFHNPCGLKTSSAAGNRPEDHQRFPDWAAGFVAHRDHLALYAGAPGYPRALTPDPRHFASIAGKAPTVEALGTRWAPDVNYGVSIVAQYLDSLLGFHG